MKIFEDNYETPDTEEASGNPSEAAETAAETAVEMTDGTVVTGSVDDEEEEEEASAPAPDYDYHDAIIQIEMLFQSHILSFGYKEYSLETFADRRYFQEWAAREGCSDTDEMRAGLNIDGILRSSDPSESEVLTYLQYTLNIAELCRRSYNREEVQGYDFDIRNYTELLSRIRALLRQLHFDVRYVPDKEFIYIVPHDPAAEAASENDADPLSRDITQYRSTSAIGQLDLKRGLLADMGRRIEAYPDNLTREHAALFSRIEFMLGNMNIRNNNISGEDRVERVAAMSPEEMEHWYDETYQLLLLRILEHRNVSRMEEIDAIAEECGVDISAISEEEIASLLNGELPPDVPDEVKSVPEVQERKRKQEEVLPEEKDKNTEKPKQATGKVILAIVIADILFVLFILCWIFLWNGV